MGSWGKDAGEFEDAIGVAVDSHDNVYVVDEARGRVQKFDSNGTFISQWNSGKLDSDYYSENILTQLFGLSGNDEQLSRPCGIAIDSHDNVYVTDTGNNRVMKFKP